MGKVWRRRESGWRWMKPGMVKVMAMETGVVTVTVMVIGERNLEPIHTLKSAPQ